MILVADDLPHPTAANDHLTPTSFQTDTNEFADLPLLFDVFNPLDWRREVKERGKYWQWRKGSGDYRPSRYGGTFDRLDEERQAQYEHNKHIYGRNRKAQQKAKAKGAKAPARAPTRGPRNAPKRHRVLPDQRRADQVRGERDGLTPTA